MSLGYNYSGIIMIMRQIISSYDFYSEKNESQCFMTLKMPSNGGHKNKEANM
ncbi:hypothetical protein AT1219_10799 [Vibrio alginolyticus]